jgi:hypothetical protein
MANNDSLPFLLDRSGTVFIHDLRTAVLEPDTVRGTPLDMSQYKRLFGTSRVPTNVRFLAPSAWR